MTLARLRFASRLLYAFGAPSPTRLRPHPPLERILNRFCARRRETTSTNPPSTLSATDEAVHPTGSDTSVAWVQVHDRSPVSYGLDTANGYLELVPAKTSLPCRVHETLHSMSDFIRYATFPVCYRRSMLDTPVIMAQLELRDIYVGKAGKAKADVTMDIGRDLIGKFTARDKRTKGEASIVFDGRAASGMDSDEKLQTCLDSDNAQFTTFT